jgi:hypothetical protein
MAEGQYDSFYAKMVDNLRYSMDENKALVLRLRGEIVPHYFRFVTFKNQ